MEAVFNILIGLALTIGFIDNIFEENYFKTVIFGLATLVFGYLMRF